MSNAVRICCSNVAYRKGFIEVRANIHEGFVNLEAWRIEPDIDISRPGNDLGMLPEGAVTANTEIELNTNEAEQLIRLLQEAVKQAKERSNGKNRTGLRC